MDAFPYVTGGKELAKKPMWVQILVPGSLGASLIGSGMLADQAWPSELASCSCSLHSSRSFGDGARLTGPDAAPASNT
jgi:hypothetical protein